MKKNKSMNKKGLNTNKTSDTYSYKIAITPDEILDIAKIKFPNPELECFKQRFLVAYTTGLPLSFVLKGGKKRIVNDCLIINDHLRRKRIIPLHPLVINFFESIEYQSITIPYRMTHQYIPQIGQAAGLATTVCYVGEGPNGGDLKIPRYKFLYPDGLASTAMNFQEECGFPHEFMNMLAGYRLLQPENRTKYNDKLSELFATPFYDCLKYLTAH